MTDYKFGVIEARFANIVWEHEPLTTGELVKLCAQKLNWKRTTMYTVLKKLSEHGIFQMKDGVVSAVCSKEDYYAIQSELFLEQNYKGSLVQFIAAFTKRKALNEEEIAEICNIINSAKKV